MISYWREGVPHNEELVGAAIRKFRRANVVVGDKPRRQRPQAAALVPGAGAAGAQQLEESLARLGTDYIDIFRIEQAKSLHQDRGHNGRAQVLRRRGHGARARCTTSASSRRGELEAAAAAAAAALLQRRRPAPPPTRRRTWTRTWTRRRRWPRRAEIKRDGR